MVTREPCRDLCTRICAHFYVRLIKRHTDCECSLILTWVLWHVFDLQEGQKELREMTAASLDKLLEGHGTLQLQQGALKEGQQQLDASISENLQRLAQEKALISTGQQLVAQLIQGITQRMGQSHKNAFNSRLTCEFSLHQWCEYLHGNPVNVICCS